MRVKLLGIRSDVGAMYAIGSIKEDYLGFVLAQGPLLSLDPLLTHILGFHQPNYSSRKASRKPWSSLVTQTLSSNLSSAGAVYTKRAADTAAPLTL